MLHASDITVSLGRKQILHGISIAAKPGEITAIVGHNGSGKTTMMRALTGDVSYGGSITINDQDLESLNPERRAEIRGVLPQANALAFPFRVIEVVEIGLLRAQPGGTSARQALAQVGLTGYEQRFYQELSGGEQQRVHLARVLAQVGAPVVDGQPRWLMLDEPVSALDIAHQLQVMDLAREFARAGGGVLAIMHDLNLTSFYADHMILLSGGRLLADGTPAEVMTDDTLSRAYGCSLQVGVAPPPGVPFLLPQMAGIG